MTVATSVHRTPTLTRARSDPVGAGVVAPIAPPMFRTDCRSAPQRPQESCVVLSRTRWGALAMLLSTATRAALDPATPEEDGRCCRRPDDSPPFSPKISDSRGPP
jgi:hypothetical protein